MIFFYKSGIFCLFILFSFKQSSNAQNESLRFEHVGIEEGLSNNNVSAILQDSKGYIWFGTMDGLNKYDGYSFTKYQFDPFDSSSLSQNTIYTIWEDKYGFIWVGTYEGLCRFDRSTEKFTRFKPDPNAKFSDPNISAVNEDRDGMIWAGSFMGGLCRLDRQKGIFVDERFEILWVNCIYKDKAGTLWVGNPTGLHRINLTAKKAGKLSGVSFTHYQYDPSNPNSLSSNHVRSIFEDHEGIMWLATDKGLNSFDKKTGLFKRYLHDLKNIHNKMANLIKEDQEGNLWIATDKGLNRLSSDRSVFTTYLHDSNDSHSLSSDIVISLHIDSAGILYAGSWGGKLSKANLNPKPFGLIRRDPNNLNSLSNNAVTSIIEDSSGIIWIATYGGGLNRWDRKTNRFAHFRRNPASPKTTLKSDSITALFEDRHGHLWVCNGDVLSQLNKQTGKFIHYNTKDEHTRFIFSIAEDREGFLWLGTANGLKRFDEKKGEFLHHYYDPANTTNGISDGAAITVCADSRDNIWVGNGSKATDRFNKRTGRFEHYRYIPGDSTSISQNVVKTIFEDSKGNLWLGTLSGGLCYFDYQKEKFTTFTEKHGLPANNVYSILTDNKGQLWVGTSNGLSRFDPGTKIFTNYDYKDGLQSNVFVAVDKTTMSKGACFKASDGTLYFGGNNGFNFFDPLQIKANSYVAPIVITQFKLFDTLVKGAIELTEIVLKHNQNYFSFEFSSLSYYNPSKNQYAYKLEGVDKDWIYSGSRRYAAYTNIDPGTYTFRVKGTNNDGVWNENGTSITIIIKPPWWNTWLFRVVATLCLVASYYGLIRWRIHQKFKQRLQQSEKEKQVAELQQQKTELEMQALRAQMNPHFIFNSLNSINRFILQNNKARASEYLTKFSRLVRLILQNSQQALISLESELESLQLYLELEALRFDYHFEFKITIEDELDTDIIKIPPLIIQPYAENAIWHGLMNKEEKGHLEIKLFQEEDSLCCRITDDGIGRKKAAELKSKSASIHKSIGMQITASRIEMLQHKKQLDTSIKITDLVLADGSADGTEVIIKMPLMYEDM
ncbi:sensor histidine kinase [Terrimonas pollutisoli]|uniref:sensor histidine kinase n=1 Tax=Terrimonas pollutisoli TaxID=3034147 RepID=UPI0023EAA4B4|nr:sensor histidine kinase [Terrimonas sp. H1YJ31]